MIEMMNMIFGTQMTQMKQLSAMRGQRSVKERRKKNLTIFKKLSIFVLY
jgi:hypothetical protein